MHSVVFTDFPVSIKFVKQNEAARNEIQSYNLSLSIYKIQAFLENKNNNVNKFNLLLLHNEN